jgi:hypothetical protein
VRSCRRTPSRRPARWKRVCASRADAMHRSSAAQACPRISDARCSSARSCCIRAACRCSAPAMSCRNAQYAAKTSCRGSDGAEPAGEGGGEGGQEGEGEGEGEGDRGRGKGRETGGQAEGRQREQQRVLTQRWVAAVRSGGVVPPPTVPADPGLPAPALSPLERQGARHRIGSHQAFFWERPYTNDYGEVKRTI